VFLKNVNEIRKGQTTAVFARNPDPKTEHLSFSILYNTDEEENRSLDLVANSVEDYELWLSTLQHLIEKEKRNKVQAVQQQQQQK
jgi:hypothetical protein